MCIFLPQILTDVLHHVIVRGSKFMHSTDGHMSLARRVAAVHGVYGDMQESLHWFGQLTCHNPGILAGLAEQLPQILPSEDEDPVRTYEPAA